MRAPALLRLAPPLLLLCASAHAGVLAEDRADILYHRYEGGGITVQGPSVLVRKKIGESAAVSANYYVDEISSASIDVVTQASPYKEQRKQMSLDLEGLHGKTNYRLGYIDSKEPDYKSRTAHFNISEDMFGDLTTVSFGYSRGWDVVGRRGSPDFSPHVQRRNYDIGLTQVLTRKLIGTLAFETSESEGYLNNPYRQVRYIDGDVPQGYGWQAERYPHTRTGNAFAAGLKYHLPWRAALDGNYRFYTDTWGIRADTARLGYTFPMFRHWQIEGHARYYKQNQANFYSDLFGYRDQQNFLARDRELAAFKNLSFGLTASYDFRLDRLHWLQHGTLNLAFDRMRFNYSDYRDVRRATLVPGNEPLYQLDANVLQLFLSIWF